MIENCENCPVMQINKQLRDAYDWANKTKIFISCGETLCGNKKENILCFARYYAKTVDWKKLAEAFEKNKTVILKEMYGK